MLTKKQKRAPIGRRTDQDEYPRISFMQGLDFAINAKRAEGLRERTLKDYNKHFGYFFTWLTENYPEMQFIDELTPSIIRDHINYMRFDAKRYANHKYINSDKQRIGLSDTTVNIRLRTLKAIFNQLRKDKLIEINAFESVNLLRQDVDLTNCLTDDEVKVILKQPNQRDYVGFRDYVGIVTMLDSGLRIKELLSLRMGDIDFQARFFTIDGEVSKNRKPRLIPFSSFTSKLLLQLISKNKQHFSTDRVFLSCFGQPLGANQFNKRLKYYGEKAGVNGKKMTAHVYRHTWAKNMTLSGADPFSLQKMGGWLDIRTVRRYIQMDTSDIRKSHDDHSPINKLLGSKRRV
ncbi:MULTISPECIES: site-specific integrase [Paenibacillus]|uniref:tyrosine-type recombinase/integrase n=1 Tax=Paenibacillus TaxID=44249 RepID=UPI00096C63F1|nr:site-specific integrase [Paenibacillus odorifer]OMD80438.1 integrase [Paenibacillus odorifer]